MNESNMNAFINEWLSGLKKTNKKNLNGWNQNK